MEMLYSIGRFFVVCGEKLSDGFENVRDFFDRRIHREEYARARRRKIAALIVLGVIGTIVVALFFPYRLVVKKNGDFEYRCLLLRVSRNTPGTSLPATKKAKRA